MKVAIVILNWNGKPLLEQFLPTMLAFTKDVAEIYVADNASTDDSVAYVKSNFSDVKIIQNGDNGGYAKGYNDALRNIDAQIFALVNSDIEVTKDWLQPIISQFKKEPNTAAIQPKILDFKDKSKFEYAGAGGGYIDKYGYPFCRGRLFETLEEDKGQFNDVADIFWASGACFFIRKNVFIELNGFDDSFFAHQEEIDLCWRIQNAGFNIQYVGASTVYHVGGATLNKANPRKTYLNFRNSLYIIVKNLPKGKLLPILFIRMLLDGVAALKFLMEFQPKHFLAVLKAHFHFYMTLSKFLAKRKSINANKKNYYRVKSIVWQYFVLRRKKFEQLD
jgi:GT2 family glycosyltransferase